MSEYGPRPEPHRHTHVHPEKVDPEVVSGYTAKNRFSIPGAPHRYRFGTEPAAQLEYLLHPKALVAEPRREPGEVGTTLDAESVRKLRAITDADQAGEITHIGRGDGQYYSYKDSVSGKKVIVGRQFLALGLDADKSVVETYLQAETEEDKYDTNTSANKKPVKYDLYFITVTHDGSNDQPLTETPDLLLQGITFESTELALKKAMSINQESATLVANAEMITNEHTELPEQTQVEGFETEEGLAQVLRAEASMNRITVDQIDGHRRKMLGNHLQFLQQGWEAQIKRAAREKLAGKKAASLDEQHAAEEKAKHEVLEKVSYISGSEVTDINRMGQEHLLAIITDIDDYTIRMEEYRKKNNRPKGF